MDKAALLSGKTIADWHYSDKGKNALSGLHVGQMVMDGKGRIWVSTYTRLNCINPNDMKVVQVANSDVVNYLMADSKGNIWMGESIVSTHPYILPFIYKASPDDVVRNRSIIAGIVDIMGDGIGECHLIESVICSDIEIAGSICRKTFDGIAVESWNL